MKNNEIFSIVATMPVIWGGFSLLRWHKKVTGQKNTFSPFRFSLFIILALTGTFSGNVSANTAPDAVDDVMTLVRGQTTTILENEATSVLDNDTDTDGDNLSVLSTISDPVHGALTLNPDGTSPGML